MYRVVSRAPLRNTVLTIVSKQKLYQQHAVLCCEGKYLRHCSSGNTSRVVNSLLPTHDEFSIRHIGPRESDQTEMLRTLGLQVRCFAHI